MMLQNTEFIAYTWSYGDKYLYSLNPEGNKISYKAKFLLIFALTISIRRYVFYVKYSYKTTFFSFCFKYIEQFKLKYIILCAALKIQRFRYKYLQG